MSQNYFLDNEDLQFHFQNLEIDEVVRLREKNFSQGIEDISSAMKLYREKLDLVGKLSAENIAPRADGVDKENSACINNKVIFPKGTLENLEDIKAAGLTGITLPRRFGGLNFPTTIYSMMTEMVSRADASLQNLFGLQSIAETIRLFGSEEQKNAVLPGFAAGDLDGAMCLTEPDAGSDLQSLKLSAKQDENGVWRLNGLKHFITNGCAKVLLVLARSEEGSRDGRGLSLFLAHPCPEIVVNRIEDKMGIHGSPTCELQFNNAPAELVGKRKFGLIKYVMSLMNGARLAISAQSVGVAEAARKAAWAYCTERNQFGKPLSQIKPVWEMLSRMDALTAASRALLYETCKYVDLRDAWHDFAEENPGDKEAAAQEKYYSRLADVMTPVTKAFNTEAANQCAYDCIQCHGGKGYMRERPVERFYRDARIMNIYEGTTQMQVIAATAGIFKGSLSQIMDKLEEFSFAPETMDSLTKVRGMRKMVEEAQTMLADSTENMELLSRRIVRGITIVFAAMLLLKNASVEPGKLDVAKRFIWEFLPEAGMHASIVKSSLEATE